MSIFSVSNIKISGLSACVPKKRALNRELSFLTENERSLLVKRVGIEERRVAPSDMTAADLCFTAATKLLEDLNWKPEEIGFLIFVSQTPDYIIPGSAPILQDRLGLSKNCAAFDINQGCAGYVYGMATLATLMSTSPGAKGLLLVGDTITHFIDENDQSLIPIFSDAGSFPMFNNNK